MQKVVIPLKVRRHWTLYIGKVFQSTYKYDSKRIFKFAYQPDSGELLFDIAPTFHDQLIRNCGKRKFNDYVRGICFWDKRVIYLRGHENEVWLKTTKIMLRENGIPATYRIMWGKRAAEELETDLKGL